MRIILVFLMLLTVLAGFSTVCGQFQPPVDDSAGGIIVPDPDFTLPFGMDEVLIDSGEDPAQMCAALTDEAIEAIRKNGGTIPLCTVEQPAGKAEVVQAGNGIQFTTKDFNGNTANSADIFARKKVTMVNLWGSFCGFCIGELAELNRLNQEYLPKGAQVIGIVYDFSDSCIFD